MNSKMAIRHAPAYVVVSSNSSHVRLVGLLTNIIKTQNSHLHDAPPTDMNPATVGPKAGPANGAATKMAKAFPRSRVPQMSEITTLPRCYSNFILDSPSRAFTYPELVSGPAAKTPPKNRRTSNEPVLSASAIPI